MGGQKSVLLGNVLYLVNGDCFITVTGEYQDCRRREDYFPSAPEGHSRFVKGCAALGSASSFLLVTHKSKRLHSSFPVQRDY